jgi:hypothetical protein
VNEQGFLLTREVSSNLEAQELESVEKRREVSGEFGERARVCATQGAIGRTKAVEKKEETM